MTIPTAGASTYGDFAGLESLKRAAHSDNPTAVREVARQFESLFARMLVKSMRDAIGPDPIFGSDQEQTYQQMYDDQLAKEITRGHGLGLADMLVRQLQRKGAGGPHSAGAAGAGSTAAQSAGTAAGSGATVHGAAGASAPGAASHGVPAASSAERKHFISEMLPQARRAADELGVAPESLIAQAALETSWGRRVPRDASGRSSNNLFGLKASESWSGPRVAAGTHELEGGTLRPATGEFRAYGSRAQSFQDYVALLRSDPRYAGALGTGGNVEAFAGALQRGGYATDPGYARKVSAIAADVASALADQRLAAQPASSGEPLKIASAAPITAGADSVL